MRVDIIVVRELIPVFVVLFNFLVPRTLGAVATLGLFSRQDSVPADCRFRNAPDRTLQLDLMIRSATCLMLMRGYKLMIQVRFSDDNRLGWFANFGTCLAIDNKTMVRTRMMCSHHYTERSI